MKWMVLAGVVAAACSGGTTSQPSPVGPADPAPTRAGSDDAKLEARLRELEAGFATNKKTMEDKIAQLETDLDACRAKPIAAAPVAPRPVRPGMLDPAKRYPVPVDDSPAIGPANAPVTMVAAVQFPEPYTHRVWPTLVTLHGAYPKDLRIVFKTFIVHPRATKSSITACAAGMQRRLDKMEDAIYNAANDGGPTRELDEAELRELARGLRMDLKLYDKDVVTCTAALVRDVAMFKNLGQGAVPVFWINGRPLSGAQPIEEFRKMIDEEKAAAAADKARGGKAADYYDRVTKPTP